LGSRARAAIIVVVAPEKPVSAKTCSAAARMRASLCSRRSSRRLVAAGANCSAAANSAGESEFDRLVSFGLASGLRFMSGRG